EDILKNGKDIRVAQQTLQNLGRMLDSSPEARELMNWFVKNCAQTDLCSLAESYRQR
ncbi:MAG: hypothetical protein H7318_00580, partial [Oligoflexus sp.]|nr:hypothetical protein [Oligoflexus sp.]